MKTSLGAIPLVVILCGCPGMATDDEDGGNGSASGGQHPSSSTSFRPASSSSSGDGSSSLRPSSASSNSSSSSAGASAAGSSSSDGASSGATSGASSSEGGSSSSGTADPPAYVFAHSDTNLYRLDAVLLTISDLGPFVWRDENNQSIGTQTMTDIAVTSAGQIFGCTYTHLYRVDMPGVVARRLAGLNDTFNGLTFLPAGFIDFNNEVLVGASNTDGTLYRIDVATGTSSEIGSYGSGWVSSGDIVGIRGDGVYATVTKGFSDHLASVNPITGQATIIGAGIGFNDLWGLGYWSGTLYGFSDTGQVVAINKTSGAGSLVTTLPVSFYGAGVTTHAKVQ